MRSIEAICGHHLKMRRVLCCMHNQMLRGTRSPTLHRAKMQAASPPPLPSEPALPPSSGPPLLRVTRPHASTIPVPLRIPSQTHVAPRGTYCRVMSLIASCATMPPRRADVCGNVECGVARVLFFRAARPRTVRAKMSDRQRDLVSSSSPARSQESRGESSGAGTRGFFLLSWTKTKGGRGGLGEEGGRIGDVHFLAHVRQRLFPTRLVDPHRRRQVLLANPLPHQPLRQVRQLLRVLFALVSRVSFWGSCSGQTTMGCMGGVEEGRGAQGGVDVKRDVGRFLERGGREEKAWNRSGVEWGRLSMCSSGPHSRSR